jgi:hypothetical protein
MNLEPESFQPELAGRHRPPGAIHDAQSIRSLFAAFLDGSKLTQRSEIAFPTEALNHGEGGPAAGSRFG